MWLELMCIVETIYQWKHQKPHTLYADSVRSKIALCYVQQRHRAHFNKNPLYIQYLDIIRGFSQIWNQYVCVIIIERKIVLKSSIPT